MRPTCGPNNLEPAEGGVGAGGEVGVAAGAGEGAGAAALDVAADVLGVEIGVEVDAARLRAAGVARAVGVVAGVAAAVGAAAGVTALADVGAAGAVDEGGVGAGGLDGAVHPDAVSARTAAILSGSSSTLPGSRRPVPSLAAISTCGSVTPTSRVVAAGSW